MESKDELKEIDIKNCTSYYFDDIIKNRDIYLVDILLDERMFENISVYENSYKNSTGPKPLSIRFNKIDEFSRVHSGEFRHLIFFDYVLLDKICDKVKYLICEKIGITDSINQNFGEIRIDSFNSLLIEKTLTFHHVLIHIKSVVNKNKNEYYCNIFLEKGSYKGKFDTQYF